MDGRAHPDPDPTWYGHSVGHWEGDTLVIDTVGYNDKFWFDFRGHPHTEQLHTIERYTRKNLGTLVNEITIDDPGAYSKPFTVTFNARLMPKGEIWSIFARRIIRTCPTFRARRGSLTRHRRCEI